MLQLFHFYLSLVIQASVTVISQNIIASFHVLIRSSTLIKHNCTIKAYVHAGIFFEVESI